MTDQVPGGAPDLEEILDWLEHRLPDDCRADLERRLAQAGPQTAELVTWARAFLADSTALPLVSPPPLVSQRLRRLSGARFGRHRPAHRVHARPVLDSRAADDLVQVRGPASVGERIQLVFHTEDAEVVLDVTPEGPPGDCAGADPTVTVRGQVLPSRPTPPVFEATARGPSGTVSTILGDDLGGFELAGVPIDTEQLVLTNDELVIEIDVDLRGTRR